jgi:hypothetical protein
VPRGRQRVVRYQIKDGVAHRDVRGQTLLLTPGGHRLQTLNSTGQFVWRRLKRAQTLDGLARAVARAFGIPVATARADVELFVKSLVRQRLLRKE